MSRRQALLFDLDGVLVDVSTSLRQAIRLTVEHFSGRKVTTQLIQRYKDMGGQNNDWDLCLRMLSDMGVEVERGRLVDRFQSVYRGDDFDGLIRGEKWLLRDPVLARAAAGFPLGIVTGRPREEAVFTIERSGTGGRFPVLVAMEDVPAGRGKPDPFGINLALRALDAEEGWYLGDNPDDITAARGAGLVPIGVVPPGCGSAPWQDTAAALREAGAGTIIYDVNDIMEFLK